MASNTQPPRGYSTAQTAAVLGVQIPTIHVRLRERGEYLGLRPVKLANRRWLWPADQVDAVARGETLSEVGV